MSPEVLRVAITLLVAAGYVMGELRLGAARNPTKRKLGVLSFVFGCAQFAPRLAAPQPDQGRRI
jgi:hypothetical protein